MSNWREAVNQAVGAMTLPAERATPEERAQLMWYARYDTDVTPALDRARNSVLGALAAYGAPRIVSGRRAGMDVGDTAIVSTGLLLVGAPVMPAREAAANAGTVVSARFGLGNKLSEVRRAGLENVRNIQAMCGSDAKCESSANGLAAMKRMSWGKLIVETSLVASSKDFFPDKTYGVWEERTYPRANRPSFLLPQWGHRNEKGAELDKHAYQNRSKIPEVRCAYQPLHVFQHSNPSREPTASIILKLEEHPSMLNLHGAVTDEAIARAVDDTFSNYASELQNAQTITEMFAEVNIPLRFCGWSR